MIGSPSTAATVIAAPVHSPIYPLDSHQSNTITPFFLYIFNVLMVKHVALVFLNPKLAIIATIKTSGPGEQ